MFQCSEKSPGNFGLPHFLVQYTVFMHLCVPHKAVKKIIKKTKNNSPAYLRV